ncbi:MAG TPA: histidine--tRNA ligase [Actinomycetota bacterium]|jgi:histidyl-tRNA synthetase
MELKPPRGTQDFLPPAGDRMRELYERASALARRYGYRYVETPVFEHTELFSRTSGQSSDIVMKEMYTFEDRGGRQLTLRPEETAPVMRAYLNRMHDLPSPFKAYYLARMYRYGRPQAGRYREHRQFGIEVLGAAEPAADVEVIAVGHRFLRDLGLSRFRLELNSLGDENCRPAYREELLAYLRANRNRLRDEHRDRFEENPLRVLDCKDDACRDVAGGAPKISDRLCEACSEHFSAVQRGLKEEGVEAVLTPTLVRGLDYYTRTAFEFVSEVLSQAQATLFGGGRYDGLAEALGGPRVPAVGYGLGLERVLLALEDEGVEPPAEPPLDAFVVAIGDEGMARAGEVIRTLREAGLSASTSFEARPLGAQLRMADRAGATFAVIVGKREAAAGTVKLKRLSDGHEEEVGLDQAIEHMRTQTGTTG